MQNVHSVSLGGTATLKTSMNVKFYSRIYWRGLHFTYTMQVIRRQPEDSKRPRANLPVSSVWTFFVAVGFKAMGSSFYLLTAGGSSQPIDFEHLRVSSPVSLCDY